VVTELNLKTKVVAVALYQHKTRCTQIYGGCGEGGGRGVVVHPS
jgi:hypothetical protein